MEKEFGKLEITSKTELLKNLEGRELILFNMSIGDGTITRENVKLQNFVSIEQYPPEAMILENDSGVSFRSFLESETIVKGIAEYSSGKIVYQNPSLFDASDESSFEKARQIRIDKANDGYFCFGKNNPLK